MVALLKSRERVLELSRGMNCEHQGSIETAIRLTSEVERNVCQRMFRHCCFPRAEEISHGFRISAKAGIVYATEPEGVLRRSRSSAQIRGTGLDLSQWGLSENHGSIGTRRSVVVDQSSFKLSIPLLQGLWNGDTIFLSGFYGGVDCIKTGLRGNFALLHHKQNLDHGDDT